MKRAAIFAAMLTLLPVAALSQNETVYIGGGLIRETTFMDLTLLGWHPDKVDVHTMVPDVEDRASGAYIYGAWDTKLKLPGLTLNAYADRFSYDVTRRLDTLKDADGRSYIITAMVHPNNGDPRFEITARAEDAYYFLRFTFYARSQSGIDKYFADFSNLITHFQQKAPLP